MKKGFTLAELLGVIVIISLLLILVVPTIINSITKTKQPAENAGKAIIYNAADQYINTNSTKYPKGKSGRYCIPIKKLTEAGYLVSPVKDTITGEDISNKSVMVTIYSQGTTDFELKDEEDCKEISSLPMIDFIATPAGNSWVKKRTITIVYPNIAESYKSSHKIDDGNWKEDSGGRVDVPMTKMATIEAILKGNNIIKGKYKVINVDSEIPIIKSINLKNWINEKQKITITATDGISGLNGIYISTKSNIPNENDNNWIDLKSKANEEKIYDASYQNGTYYVWVKDKAGNISNTKSFKTSDNIKPTCEITDSGTKENDWYITDVMVKLTATDKESGIQSKGISTSNSVNYNDTSQMTLTLDTKSQTYYGFVKDKAGNTNTCSKTVKKDASNPNLTISTTSTTKSITVVANASATSGISKYEYSKDGGNTWVASNDNYTFTKLKQATNYNIKVRVTSGVNKQSTVSKVVTTESIAIPTFKEETTEGDGKRVIITYPSGCGSTLTCTYQKDSKEEIPVTSKTTIVYFTDSGSVVAKASDGINNVSSSYNVKITDYYVSLNGKDQDGYGTKNKPYATIQHAYDKAIQDPTNIHVLSNLNQGNAKFNGKNITLKGYNGNKYTLYRTQNSAMVEQTSSAGTLIIKDLTFDGRNASGSQINSNVAMVKLKGNVQITNVIVKYGYNSFNFGSSFNVDEQANVTLNNVEIANATATAGGAAIFSGGIITMNDVNIHNNNSLDGNVWSYGKIIFNSGKVTSNKATWDAGVRNYGQFIMNGGSITGNSATYSTGGLKDGCYYLSHLNPQKREGTSTINGNISNNSPANYTKNHNQCDNPN